MPVWALFMLLATAIAETRPMPLAAVWRVLPLLVPPMGVLFLL